MHEGIDGLRLPIQEMTVLLAVRIAQTRTTNLISNYKVFTTIPT